MGVSPPPPAGLSKLCPRFASASFFCFCFTLYAPRRLHFRSVGEGGGVAIAIHFLRLLIRLLNRFYDVFTKFCGFDVCVCVREAVVEGATLA